MICKTLPTAILFVLLSAVAVVSADAPETPGENDPAPNIAGETLGDVARRAGYTIKELKESRDLPVHQGLKAIPVL